MPSCGPIFGAWSGKGAFKGIIGGAPSQHGGSPIPSRPLQGASYRAGLLYLFRRPFRRSISPTSACGRAPIPPTFYEAEQAFGAAFLSAEKTIARWRLQGGLRYEYSYQQLVAATATGPISQLTPFPLLLPFAHVGYHLSEKHRIRLAYARSLNRPELRELAPFT